MPGFVFLGKAQKDDQFSLYRREGDPLLNENNRPGSKPSGNGRHSHQDNHAVDWDARAKAFAKALTPKLRQDLAEALGLPEWPLSVILTGYMKQGPHKDDDGNPIGPCWTFPERDSGGRIIGILCRYANGVKLSHPGGRRGLTLPQNWEKGTGTLFVPEGPSDVLAFLAMGVPAIGRPSNTGGVEMLSELLKPFPSDRPIVVVGEYDPKPDGKWPGYDGAVKTAGELEGKLERPMQWVMPPSGHKDARAWLLAQKPDLQCLDELQDLGETYLSLLEGNYQPAKKKAASLAFRFDVIDSATFDASNYRPEFLIRRCFVKGLPAVLGGPLKCMKTSLSVDASVSLGSATPFLNYFPVYRRVRTVILSGESGQATLQDCARRVCQERGIHLADCDILWGFRLPKLASIEDLTELQNGLKGCGAEVCVLDPLYLSLLNGGEMDAGSASNLYATGPLLLAAAETCLAVGVTPLICHHFRRSIPDPPAVPELSWLSHSGIAEFARQWLLVSRRERYEPDSGLHQLWLTAGGSVGHSGLYALDINEGQLADDFTGRTWKVAVQTASEARQATQDERETEKERVQNRKDKDNEAKVLSALDELAGTDGVAVYYQVKAMARLNTEAMSRAVIGLAKEGIIKEVPATVGVGPEHKGKREARGLVRCSHDDAKSN